MYYDHFQAGEPEVIECDNQFAVYAAKRLPDGTWHCLLTQAQKDALGDDYCPFSLAPVRCKGQGFTLSTVEGAEVWSGYPVGAPVHVYGSQVVEPDKVYRPGSATPILVEAAELEPKVK